MEVCTRSPRICYAPNGWTAECCRPHSAEAGYMHQRDRARCIAEGLVGIQWIDAAEALSAVPVATGEARA